MPDTPDIAEVALSEACLHILQHSLGVDQYGRGRRYRNHFVTGEGSIDHPHCVTLVARGLMTRHKGSALTGEMDLFRVTRAGDRYVTEHSPSPPPEPSRPARRSGTANSSITTAAFRSASGCAASGALNDDQP